MKYVFVECDNCGTLYYLYDDTTPRLPKLHAVCSVCYLPMEIVNPLYKRFKEAAD